MKGIRFLIRVALVGLLPVLFHMQGCKEPGSVDTVSVSLTNAQTYQYPTVSGDEESARISIQPKHYTVSEIRRNAETNWVFFFDDPATTEIYTLSLHDALPI